jgi:hypothetical protein
MNAHPLPAAVQASWGWVSDVPENGDPKQWERAEQLVNAGILLGFDPVAHTVTFPERLSNQYHGDVLFWVIDASGDRPQLPDETDDDYLSPFRAKHPPLDLQSVVIPEYHRTEQALVRAEALAALGIAFNVDRTLWSYAIPIRPLTHAGALAARHWVIEGGSRPNFADMCYSSA